jgi:hypothetical protein
MRETFLYAAAGAALCVAGVGVFALVTTYPGLALCVALAGGAGGALGRLLGRLADVDGDDDGAEGQS